jgi:hypothetical protein
MTNYPSRLVFTLLAGGLIAVLGACRPVTATPEASSAAPAAEAVAATDSTATITLSSSEQTLVDAALEQVVLVTNVAAGNVQLTSFAAVEWPDASLGCPQPDMMYAQVITPGYQIVFDAGGQAVEVHTDANQPPQIVICQP